MADNQDFKEEISEDELDQIIQDMSKEDESAEAVATQAKSEAAPVTEAPAPVKSAVELVQSKKKASPSASPSVSGPSSSQSLTLEMNGVVNLKLCFKNGDRSIEVLCTEDHLVCRMADGTEFKIPTGNQGKVRKAA